MWRGTPSTKQLPSLPLRAMSGKSIGTLLSYSFNLPQGDMYAWDSATGAWENSPIVTTDRAKSAIGRIWQHTFTLMATKNSERAVGWRRGKSSLPPGKYLLKVYVDRLGRTNAKWQTPLTKADSVGHFLQLGRPRLVDA